MNPLISHFSQSSMKKNLPDLRPGDTVRVHQRIREGNKTRIQVFEGLVIAVRGGKSINSSFVVRYVHKGTRVGVEKTFPMHSPNIEKIERLKSSKVHQARLYYMRERFGRRARMKGEAKNSGDWVEAVEMEEVTSVQAEGAESSAEETTEPVVENETETGDVKPTEEVEETPKPEKTEE